MLLIVIRSYISAVPFSSSIAHADSVDILVNASAGLQKSFTRHMSPILYRHPFTALRSAMRHHYIRSAVINKFRVMSWHHMSLTVSMPMRPNQHHSLL